MTPCLSSLGHRRSVTVGKTLQSLSLQASAVRRVVVKIIAARHALYRDERETFEETLRKLSFARVAVCQANNLALDC
jgi:hypothetical protein